MDNKEQENKISSCMIGTWAWGAGTNGSKMIFGKSYEKEELKKIFQYAYDCGFTMWDTAEVYGQGNSERILGECVQQLADQENVFLSTKHFPKKKYTEGAMTQSLQGSRKRLGIQAPNIYWIHVPNNLERTIADAIQLQLQKKIGSIGLSNVSLEEIRLAERMLQEVGLTIGGIQNHYSLLSRGNGQEEIIFWCKEHKVNYFAYMVLEQGALSGHYDAKHTFPRFSMRGLSFPKRKFKKIEQLLLYERELGQKYGINTAQIPILWAIEKGTIPIIGITRMNYVDEMRKALQVHLLPEEVAKLEQIASTTGVYCKGSWEPHK